MKNGQTQFTMKPNVPNTSNLNRDVCAHNTYRFFYCKLRIVLTSVTCINISSYNYFLQVLLLRNVDPHVLCLKWSMRCGFLLLHWVT